MHGVYGQEVGPGRLFAPITAVSFRTPIMTDSPPPSPLPPPPRPWRLMMLVALGAAAPLGLALAGQASPLAAVVAASAAAALGAALLMVRRAPPPPPPPTPVEIPVERPWTPPFRAMLDRLADPI